MTLILSLAHPHYSLQVSDRRVTFLRGGGIKDDHRNKMVLFDNRLSFGYTGLAELEGINTDRWIAKTVAHKDVNSLSDATARLAAEARGAALRSGEAAPNRRLAIVGTGWALIQGEQEYTPLQFVVSNFHKSLEETEAVTRDDFKVFHRVLEPDQAAWLSVGARLTPKEAAYLQRYLPRRDEPFVNMRLLCEMVRRVANRSNTVGKDLLIGLIPKTAAGCKGAVLAATGSNAIFTAGFQSGEESAAAALDRRNHVYFLNLPPGKIKPVLYGPNIVANGVIVESPVVGAQQLPVAANAGHIIITTLSASGPAA